MCVTISGESCHKHNFSHDKSFLPTNTCLPRQICVCRDKRRQTFCRDKYINVATKLWSRQIFIATNIILSRQMFCHDQLTFVATNTRWSRQNTSSCRDKSMLVATNRCLSRQKFCRKNKMPVPFGEATRRLTSFTATTAFYF